MPRRPLYLTDRFPYHVTSRSNNKEWFYLPTEEVWWAFAASLGEITKKYEAHIYAFVLMSNHFHLLLSTPYANLGDVMRDLLTKVSKTIQQRSGRINHIFGARYRWSLLDSAYGVGYVLKYVLRNPVRGGLASRVEEYPFSSIGSAGKRLPLVCGSTPLWKHVPKERAELIEWLNQPVPGELERLITQSLRQERFQFSKDNSKQKKLRELRSAYGVSLLESLEGA